MAAEDELALPQVPEAKPEDSEDISWALSTAEAMWARGDHVEGIKWVRKAAEAASEIEDDERALELAKAASELATMIARRSMLASSEALPQHAPPSTGGHPPSAHPASAPPNTARMPGSPSIPAQAIASIPPAPPVPLTASAPPPAAQSSAPGGLGSSGPSGPAAPRAAMIGKSGAPAGSVRPGPIPLPSRASVAPKAGPMPVAARAAPRPLATSDARQGPQAGRGILTNRTASEPPKGPKGKRKSRENLDAEAKAAGVIETAPQTPIDGPTADRVLSSDTAEVAAVEMPVSNARVKRRPEPEPTVVTTLNALAMSEREKSAEEWDASPTENLTGGDMDSLNNGDRATAFGMQAAAPVAASHGPSSRGPSLTVHDPEIQTSQAVRVVVWRDANGVHVAPAGTVVSSITIDAVLVVLEPSADLTAWLSHRDR